METALILKFITLSFYSNLKKLMNYFIQINHLLKKNLSYYQLLNEQFLYDKGKLMYFFLILFRQNYEV